MEKTQQSQVILRLSRAFIQTNVLTKFHKSWTINVTSNELTRKIASHSGGNACFSTNRNHIALIQAIITTNVLPKFHKDGTVNATFRQYKEKCPTHSSHVRQQTGTFFELLKYIIKTNVLTQVHEDWTTNVTFRVSTKIAQPPGGYVFFQPTGTILQLAQDIIWTKILTTFHKDRKIDVASRVFTRKRWSWILRRSHEVQKNKTIPRKCELIHEGNIAPEPENAPPQAVMYFFQRTHTIFKLCQNIITTKVSLSFTTNVTSRVKNAPSLVAMFFQQTGTVFELIQDIIAINNVTKFHDDWTVNGTKVKTAPPPPHPLRPCFQPTGSIFELMRDTCSDQVS
ncbi:hypothetical protein DPMN_089068 [Dreissena polymorpha]|uniref:Uncharacterized protein n=1 Tax=Dreissena polymorpha TaxID=45954 RepID=A0A9D4KX31_DREPO|nr:hypothetical protein DPMN_089068 [Dreissena polymorpha]